MVTPAQTPALPRRRQLTSPNGPCSTNLLMPAASGWREEGIHDGGRELRLGDQRIIRKSRFISLTLRIGFF